MSQSFESLITKSRRQETTLRTQWKNAPLPPQPPSDEDDYKQTCLQRRAPPSGDAIHDIGIGVETQLRNDVAVERACPT